MNGPFPLIVLTTVGSMNDAERIALDLVERRLAACVNILDQARSIYRWQGRVENEGETLLVIKTLSECLSSLEARLHEIHPYETPEFVVIPVQRVSEAYGRWLVESCGLS